MLYIAQTRINLLSIIHATLGIGSLKFQLRTTDKLTRDLILLISPLSERRVDLISRTQSSELDLWMADILLSLVNVNRPMVSRLVSRWRTHET